MLHKQWNNKDSSKDETKDNTFSKCPFCNFIEEKTDFSEKRSDLEDSIKCRDALTSLSFLETLSLLLTKEYEQDRNNNFFIPFDNWNYPILILFISKLDSPFFLNQFEIFLFFAFLFLTTLLLFFNMYINIYL